MERLLILLPVALYALAIFWITYRTGKRQSGQDHDYFLANRSLGVFFSLVSVVATETSVATVLIFPQMGYKSGLSLLWMCAGFIAGRWLVAHYFLPEIYRRHRLSMYATITGQSSAARKALSFSYLAAKVISSSVRFLMAAFALHLLFGAPVWLWILLMALLAGLYSVLGGLSAVVITDQIQGWIIVIGAVLVIIALLPGLQDASLPALADWQARLDNSRYSPLLFFGAMTLSLGTHGADQDMLQRVLATRSLQDAQRALRWSGIAATIVISLYLLAGWMLARAALPGVGETAPVLDYVRLYAHPLALGGFGVVLIAAAMSTLDSTLHSTAAVWKAALSERVHARTYSFFSLLLLVVAAMLLIPVQERSRSFYDLAMNAFNYVNGGLIAVFLLFLVRRRHVGMWTILAAVSGGLATTVAANYGLQPALAWPLVTLLSTAVATMLAFCTSYFLSDSTGTSED
ncbi:MAG: hypothetical protein K1X75_12245 [Leptospirales bacterium]|nr:hypothetical protein [Leptospirales bacterium]